MKATEETTNLGVFISCLLFMSNEELHSISARKVAISQLKNPIIKLRSSVCHSFYAALSQGIPEQVGRVSSCASSILYPDYISSSILSGHGEIGVPLSTESDNPNK